MKKRLAPPEERESLLRFFERLRARRLSHSLFGEFLRGEEQDVVAGDGERFAPILWGTAVVERFNKTKDVIFRIDNGRTRASAFNLGVQRKEPVGVIFFYVGSGLATVPERRSSSDGLTKRIVSSSRTRSLFRNLRGRIFDATFSNGNSITR